MAWTGRDPPSTRSARDTSRLDDESSNPCRTRQSQVGRDRPVAPTGVRGHQRQRDATAGVLSHTLPISFSCNLFTARRPRLRSSSTPKGMEDQRPRHPPQDRETDELERQTTGPSTRTSRAPIHLIVGQMQPVEPFSLVTHRSGQPSGPRGDRSHPWPWVRARPASTEAPVDHVQSGHEETHRSRRWRPPGRAEHVFPLASASRRHQVRSPDNPPRWMACKGVEQRMSPSASARGRSPAGTGVPVGCVQLWVAKSSSKLHPR